MRKVFKLKSEGCAVGDTLNTGAQKKKKKINRSCKRWKSQEAALLRKANI